MIRQSGAAILAMRRTAQDAEGGQRLRLLRLHRRRQALYQPARRAGLGPHRPLLIGLSLVYLAGQLAIFAGIWQ